jgi:hypothetical protein
MSGPGKVQKVEQSVQCDNQECNVSIRKSTNNHIQEAIEATFTTTTGTEISPKVPEHGVSCFGHAHQLSAGKQILKQP